MDYQQLLNYFCPLCHFGRFRPHQSIEYAQNWNKCSSCGYMELKSITKNRIMFSINPNKFSKPFIEPITAEMRDRVNHMKIGRNNINCNNNNVKNSDCSRTNQAD